MRDVEARVALGEQEHAIEDASRRSSGCGAAPATRWPVGRTRAAGTRTRRAVRRPRRKKKYSVIGYSSSRAPRPPAAQADACGSARSRSGRRLRGACSSARAHAQLAFARRSDRRRAVVAVDAEAHARAVAREASSSASCSGSSGARNLTAAMRREAACAGGFERGRDAIEQDHARHDRIAGKMPGQARMLRGNAQRGADFARARHALDAAPRRRRRCAPAPASAQQRGEEARQRRMRHVAQVAAPERVFEDQERGHQGVAAEVQIRSATPTR